MGKATLSEIQAWLKDMVDEAIARQQEPPEGWEALQRASQQLRADIQRMNTAELSRGRRR